MKRAPDWTKEEFEVLLKNWSLSDSDLSVLIPHRTMDAIKTVRSGVHGYHHKGDSPLLSKMMKEYIEQSHGLKCPLCGESLGS